MEKVVAAVTNKVKEVFAAAKLTEEKAGGTKIKVEENAAAKSKEEAEDASATTKKLLIKGESSCSQEKAAKIANYKATGAFKKAKKEAVTKAKS